MNIKFKFLKILTCYFNVQIKNKKIYVASDNSRII
jgi:hypothetical protein